LFRRPGGVSLYGLGPTPEGIAIAEFPSMEEARRWYDSPAYHAAIQHRLNGAINRGLIVEGL
jgi:uncharacterized protein (DUF1330 family)